MNNSNVCRILLLNPNISGDVRYGKFKEVGSYLPPYGLLCIAAVLEEHGHIVSVLDADINNGLKPNEIKNAIDRFEPNIIGISAYSIGRKQVINTAKHIKSFSSVLLVVGGPHVITFPTDLADIDTIDILVYGEGEIAMLDLANYRLGNKHLKEIEGILYRKNGKLIKNSPRPPISNLDSLPYPAFHLLDDVRQYKPMQLLYKKLPLMTFITGRGCPFHCIFCNSIWGNNVRFNSAEYIVGGIKKLIDGFDIREIMFYEDTFCINRQRISDLCDILIAKKISISWTCSANVRTLDKQLLQKMKNAGCWLISIGIESGNQEVLEFIKKPIKKEEVSRVCAQADEVGLKIRGFFIIGHPTDTKETIKQTIDFAKSLPLFTVNFTILQLLPGSKVRKIAHNYGEVNLDLSLGTGHPTDTLSFVPEGLTADYLKKMQRSAYRQFFLRPIQIWRLLKSIDSMEDLKKYFILVKTFFRIHF